MKLDVRDRPATSVLISGARVRKLISSGVKGYLAFLINTRKHASSEGVKAQANFLLVYLIIYLSVYSE